MTARACSALALGIALCLWACEGGGPPIEIHSTSGAVMIDLRDSGEKVSTVTRLQLRRGHDLVWDIRAVGDTAQMAWVRLIEGANPSRYNDAYFGTYETIVPAADEPFIIESGVTYTVVAWGKSSKPAEASFRLP